MRYRTRCMKPTPPNGFTLLEVMLVVAIIAIISSIAIPSYLQYVVRANRAAAQGTMLEVASRQERYLLDRRGYAADIATLTMSIPSSVSSNYTVTTPFPARAPARLPCHMRLSPPRSGANWQKTRGAERSRFTRLVKSSFQDPTVLPAAGAIDRC